MDVKIKTALVSVSDKAGVVEFAKKLSGMGVKIISTGGTARALKEAGVKWDDVEARQQVVKRKILSGEFDKFRVWKGTY